MLEIFYNLRSSIRRTIIYHQYMETLSKIENGMKDISDILLLVIGRYDY